MIKPKKTKMNWRPTTKDDRDVLISRMEDLLDSVSEVSGVSKELILAKSRYKHAVMARQVLCYVATQYGGCAQIEVADFLGYKDRSVVSHGKVLVEDIIEREDSQHPYDKRVRSIVRGVLGSFGAGGEA